MGRGLEEREINLWDMFWAVCLKWRSILACAVIFAILAGGFSYYQSIRKVENAKIEKMTAEEVAKGLTYDEKNAVDLYMEYIYMYENQRLYNSNAPIMQLDANGFYKGEISYYIDNFYEVQYPYIAKASNIVAIVNAYKAQINTNEFAIKINNALGLDENGTYGMELIDLTNMYGNTNSIDNSENSGILSISVYAADEKTCNELKEILKEQIESSKNSVTKQFGKHDLIMIQDVSQYTSDAEIITYQKTNVEKLHIFKNNMIGLLEDFTENQRMYIDISVEEMTDTAESVEDSQEMQSVPSVSMKLVVIGFVGGAFLLFVIWALAYIFGSKLRLEDDFEKIFGSKLLGNVSVNANSKRKWFSFIDKIFTKIRHYNRRYFDQDEALDMIASNIRIAVQKARLEKVMITGAVCGDDEKKVAEVLSERLKKDGIEIIYARPVLYSAESLEKLVEIGCVVLVEKAEKSLYQEVAREIEVCAQQEVNLIGCVVVY